MVIPSPKYLLGRRVSLRTLPVWRSFLARADRAGPALTLLYRHFEFHWGGHLDSTATHYLYQGESGAPGEGGDGAVYLRDLTTGETATVVPPDNKGQYAIPRFYGNDVIYFRDRLLRRVGLNASNDAPLLPGISK